jgi:hypothetical protein
VGENAASGGRRGYNPARLPVSDPCARGQAEVSQLGDKTRASLSGPAEHESWSRGLPTAGKLSGSMLLARNRLCATFHHARLRGVIWSNHAPPGSIRQISGLSALEVAPRRQHPAGDPHGRQGQRMTLARRCAISDRAGCADVAVVRCDYRRQGTARSATTAATEHLRPTKLVGDCAADMISLS